VDINPAWVKYARTRDTGTTSYAVADARALPYADASFDLVMSITALCFIEDEAAVVRELVRVARGRIAIGLLNRNSLLWSREGKDGGRGGYRGARWYTLSRTLSVSTQSEGSSPGFGSRKLRFLGGRPSGTVERTPSQSLL
jgi:hypothetical protein